MGLGFVNANDFGHAKYISQTWSSQDFSKNLWNVSQQLQGPSVSGK
jgi:hypothetical protein